jgi:hypothetical protein
MPIRPRVVIFDLTANRGKGFRWKKVRARSLVEECEEQVFGAYFGTTALDGLVPRDKNRTPRFVGEPFEHPL